MYHRTMDPYIIIIWEELLVNFLANTRNNINVFSYEDGILTGNRTTKSIAVAVDFTAYFTNRTSNVILNTDVDFDLERNRTNTLHKHIKIHYTNNLNKSIEIHYTNN
jgi:hypothetical protein